MSHKIHRRHALSTGNADIPTAAWTPDQLRQHGLRQFRNKRYDSAIATWELMPQPDGKLMAALAEAHFRQATIAHAPADALRHLERAVELAPNDAIYTFYLGLAHHRSGRAEKAFTFYQRAVTNGWAKPATSLIIGLAALESNRLADLNGMPGMSERDRQDVSQMLAYLFSQTPDTTHADSIRGYLARVNVPVGVIALLDGLALLAANHPDQAHHVLIANWQHPLPIPLHALRLYYVGVASLACGNAQQAIVHWQDAHHIDPSLPELQVNTAALMSQRVDDAIQRNDRNAAVAILLDGLKIAPHDTALCIKAVPLLAELAGQAAQAQQWKAALDHLSQALSILERIDLKAVFGKGASIRPILHNLALAQEANNLWIDAAATWREMLRTKPRRGTAQGYNDAQWAWVRRHSIECYKTAGQLGEAIVLLRRAVKADPDSADQHLDLCGALMSNDQAQAAVNELNRLVAKHPAFADGYIMLAEVQLSQGQPYLAEHAMRQALAIAPDNPDFRHRMARVLSGEASSLLVVGNTGRARELITEALTFAPDDYHLYVLLADIAVQERSKISEARQHLDRALEVGAGKAEAYGEVAAFWVSAHNLDEARGIVARADAAGIPTDILSVHLGITCFKMSVPSVSGLLTYLFNNTFSPAQPPRDKQLTEIEAWGHELISRALAAHRDVDVLRLIVQRTLAFGSTAGIRYARMLADQTPEDPTAWITLGALLGLDGQVKDAREAFSAAVRLARKLGLKDVAREAEEMKQKVANPLFPMMMRSAMSLASGNDFDLE